MKKTILLFFLLFFILFFSIAKEATIIIDNKKISLFIPDNSSDLEQAFVDAFTAWKQAENDLEKTEALLKKQKAQITNLSFVVDQSIAQNQILMNLLENRPKNKTTIFRPNLVLGIDFNLDKKINCNVGMGLTIMNWVDLALIIRVPEISFGILLTVYLRP